MRVVFLLTLLFTLPAWAGISGRAGQLFSTAEPLPLIVPYGGNVPAWQDQNAATPRTDYRRIFANIEHGFASGNISSFSQYMAPYLHVTLRGEENGYFSASQAFYLLENYFKTRKLVNFDFSTIGESEANPYATGSAGFNYKGNREYVQVYVSLSLVNGRWQITRINIY